MKIKKYIALLLASLLVISTTVPSFITAKVVADEKTSITSEYTIEEQRQIDEVAAVLEKMFADGVTEENLKQ
ncbi:streptococcin A-M57, partial [Streptococcus pyogenes]